MVVEEIQVAARQSIDLREGAVHFHRVELLAALKEGDLVAEVTHMRTAS